MGRQKNGEGGGIGGMRPIMTSEYHTRVKQQVAHRDECTAAAHSMETRWPKQKWSRFGGSGVLERAVDGPAGATAESYARCKSPWTRSLASGRG